MRCQRLVLLLAVLGAAGIACDSTSFEPFDSEGTYSGTLKADGIERRYVVHVPPASSNSPLPLIIAFHPAPGTGLLMRMATGLDLLADRDGFVVAYPDAAYGEWAVGVDDPNVTYKPERDIKFVRELVDELSGRFEIDRRRVYATGFSNGALMAFRLACDLAREIAGVAAVAATMLEPVAESCNPTLPVPILIMHGTEDPEFPPDGRVGTVTTSISIAATVDKWVALNECSAPPDVFYAPDTADDGTRVRCEEYTSCSGAAAVMYFAIEGGGHTWPGYLIEPSPRSGPMSRDIVASETITAFLLTYGRR